MTEGVNHNKIKELQTTKDLLKIIFPEENLSG